MAPASLKHSLAFLKIGLKLTVREIQVEPRPLAYHAVDPDINILDAGQHLYNIEP